MWPVPPDRRDPVVLPLALKALLWENRPPMPSVEGSPDSDEALRAFVQSHLSPAILARLDEVRECSRLSVREILEQAIDFAWHVQMSGELDRPPEAPRAESASAPDPSLTRYNGWSNYETWAVNLWLTNEQGTYHECCDLAGQAVAEAPECRQVRDRIWTGEEARNFLLADRLKEYVQEMNPLTGKASMFTDLLTAAISEVDWHEIAEAFLEEVADSDK